MKMEFNRGNSGLITFISQYLPEEEFDSFGLWSFGDTYKTMCDMRLFKDAWNERHADILLLDDDHDIKISLKLMIDLYTQHVMLNRSNNESPQ